MAKKKVMYHGLSVFTLALNSYEFKKIIVYPLNGNEVVRESTEDQEARFQFYDMRDYVVSFFTSPEPGVLLIYADYHDGCYWDGHCSWVREDAADQ